MRCSEPWLNHWFPYVFCIEWCSDRPPMRRWIGTIRNLCNTKGFLMFLCCFISSMATQCHGGRFAAKPLLNQCFSNDSALAFLLHLNASTWNPTRCERQVFPMLLHSFHRFAFKHRVSLQCKTSAEQNLCFYIGFTMLLLCFLFAINTPCTRKSMYWETFV